MTLLLKQTKHGTCKKIFYSETYEEKSPLKATNIFLAPKTTSEWGWRTRTRKTAVFIGILRQKSN